MATAADIYRAVMKPERQDHGVKGMRWGVRKPRNAGPGPASKATMPKAGKPFPKKSRKGPERMSDKELKRVISRMQLEAQYRQLTAPKPSATKKFIRKKLGEVAATQLTNVANRGATMAVASAFGLVANSVPNPQVANILRQLGNAAKG